MQTEVNTQYPVGIAGQLADLHTAEFGDVVTVTSEEASAETRFGIMVKGGTADGSSKLLAATSDVPIGIVVFAHNFAKPVQLGDDGLKPGITFGVLRRGRIWVVPEDAVTPASDVRIRCVVAGNEVKGAFRAAQDLTDCIDISGFAKWITSADAGEPAILEIDMTNSGLAVADV